ncbi:MAG: hypothetical protein ACJ8ER_14750 [Allosphingosinicella sp.]
MDVDDLPNPKLRAGKTGEWESLFPYYAGFSKNFADSVMLACPESARQGVLDPWNGAGTTTLAAAQAGAAGVGVDINPVMNVVARARAVAREDADILFPLGELLAKSAERNCRTEEPLLDWFDRDSAREIRALANSIRFNTTGGLARLGLAGRGEISGPTAVMYVALFSACKGALAALRTSNPTWIRIPSCIEDKIHVDREELHASFLEALISATSHAFAHGLEEKQNTPELIRGDASQNVAGKYGLILTSPPYCTRLDYAHLTRLELAVLDPYLAEGYTAFRRSFTGTTLTERAPPRRLPLLGDRCNRLLDAVRSHRSRASAGYYYKSHVDYYNKMSRSLRSACRSLKLGGKLVLVIQDSWYKDVHNDVPAILSDFCEREGLSLIKRRDFPVDRSLADVHKHRADYKAGRPATEAVIVFER